jgi:GDP-L-fucose synthase
LVHLAKTYSGEEHVNVGTGQEVSIAELAETIARVVGFGGGVRYDSSKPDGMPRKLMDVSRLEALGWRARTGLDDCLAQSYSWYLDNAAEAA